MFATILSILSIIASVVTSLIFWKKQTKYYKQNVERLEQARDFFLPSETYRIVSVNETKQIGADNLDGKIKDLVLELNKYISRNKGTTDFSIIQNKTERFANTIFENASSNLAFPTYMGLMGTFVGVFIGLVGFVLPDFLRDLGLTIDADEESNVTRLVYGVIVSMTTSFLGLYYTTKSNKLATEYKRIMDERKNIFYDFIQNELMPVLGMSVVHALNQLKETLLHFHESFDVVTDKFEKTFNSCTDKFGKEFEKNIVAVGNAAGKLGESIEIVNVNVDNQQKLLKELRSDGMLSALDKFISAGKQFEQSSNTVKDLDKIRTELSAAITMLLNVQKDYNSSLVVPKLIAERLNVILERITTFEESINALGKDIAQTHLLGNSEMKLIEEHLENIKRKDAIATEYQENANEELKALFDSETNIIKDLHRQYTSAIEEHGDEFKVLMDQIADAIEKKRTEFLERLETAFSIADLQTEFAQLNKLPEIHQEIGNLHQSVGNFEATVKKQSDSEIEKIGEVGSKVSELAKNVTASTVDLKSSVQTAGSQISSSLKKESDDIHAKLDSEHKENLESFVSVKESISDIKKSLDEKSNDSSAKLVEISTSVSGVKQLVEQKAELVEQQLTDNKKDFSGSVNSLVEKLNYLSETVSQILQNSENVTSVNVQALEELGKSIKQQENEVSVLESMIERAKGNVEANFDTLINLKLKDIEEKTKSLSTEVDNTKKKADSE